ncbi:hypothetical protein J437_LFUL016874 [Ladona fulva]|uniref:RING-type domain-containing protein n=1 Tax=Ladona fulva TaxID=123851 RepID=A0A8K0P899_LADFU|nr:hypothetical protein J437_LFUL016874 [Ladona fulva]
MAESHYNNELATIKYVAEKNVNDMRDAGVRKHFLNVKLFTCVENASRCDCPVCLENLHTSRDPCHVPPCGHLLHMTCYTQMRESRIFLCPTCLSQF